MASHSLAIARQFLGKEVDLVIDRPLGSRHPTHGFRYELNYGYVDGAHSPDGDFLDAYLVGIDRPLSHASGVCIAIVHRHNDDDDKLIVAPANREYSDDEIRALIHFQEQWFTSDIIRV